VFPSAAPREVYLVTATGPEQEPVLKTEAAEAVVPLKDGTLAVVVYDPATGECWSKQAADIKKAGAWKPGGNDKTRAVRVVVVVENESGEPVRSAFVSLASGGENATRLVSPGDRGQAEFRFVRAGPAKLAVRYKDAAGKEAKAQNDASIVAGSGQAGLVVVAEGAVADTTAGEAPVPTSGQPPGQGNALLNLLLGLGVLAAAGLGIAAYFRKNREQVEAALQAAGVVPQDAADDPDPAPPAVPAGPKPLEPIVLDPPATVSAPAAAAVPPAPNPRLVADDGSVWLFSDGPATVGRDPGCEIALPGETSVSRTHARLEATPDGAVVTDLGSTNGTFVNGQRVEGSVRLSPGDRVQFGAAAFRFEG
jgi:hypothetical protein